MSMIVFPVLLFSWLWGWLTGSGKAKPATEKEAAEKAAKANENGKVAADKAVDGAVRVYDVRSIVRRLAKGRELPDDLVAKVPADTVCYLEKLRPDELQVLAAIPPALLMAHIQGLRETPGVRSQAEVDKTPAAAPRPMMTDLARKRVPAPATERSRELDAALDKVAVKEHERATLRLVA